VLRTRLFALAAATLTVAAGLASRAPGLPDFVHAYVGDALYAVLIYTLLRAAFPARRVAVAALAICFAIEASQAWHLPALDAVRATRLGALVLGRGFLLSDLGCYATGAAAAALGEGGVRRIGAAMAAGPRLNKGSGPGPSPR